MFCWTVVTSRERQDLLVWGKQKSRLITLVHFSPFISFPSISLSQPVNKTMCEEPWKKTCIINHFLMTSIESLFSLHFTLVPLLQTWDGNLGAARGMPQGLFWDKIMPDCVATSLWPRVVVVLVPSCGDTCTGSRHTAGGHPRSSSVMEIIISLSYYSLGNLL